jgi:hypothetical protein
MRHEALHYRAEVKTFAVVLSQQRDEAGGSLIRETPVRVASSPDNAGTDQHYRMVRVRQARQDGVREEPVLTLLKSPASSVGPHAKWHCFLYLFGTVGASIAVLPRQLGILGVMG